MATSTGPGDGATGRCPYPAKFLEDLTPTNEAGDQ